MSARTPDVGEARETLPVPFQGEPLEIGFNPEFLRDGLEAVESGDVLLKLISPLRPGLIEAGGRSGLRLPAHADPAERVMARRRASRAHAARLPLLRGGGGRVRARAHGGRGPQRRRQDEPARGAVLRVHRPVVPDGERARVRSLRRGADAAGAALRGRRRRARAQRRLPAGRGEAAARGRRAGRAADGRRGPPARLGLPPGPPGARARRAGAAPRAPRPGRRRAVAARAATRRAYSAALAQRNALIARDPCRPRRPRVAAGLGRRARPARRRAHGRPGRGRRGARAALREHAAGLGLEGERGGLPPAPGADAEELAAELAERVDGDLERGFTGHGPTATSSCSAARGGSCAPTARAASSASACSRCCLPSARRWPEERGAAVDAAR